MVAFCYFLLFLWVTLAYRKKWKGSVGYLLLLFYSVSAFLTLVEQIVGPINNPTLDVTATIYYVACVLISLWPFLILGKYDCRNFEFYDTPIRYVSYVLIFFGIIEVVTSSVAIFNNRAIFLSNLADIRYSFYSTMDTAVTNRSAFQKITILVHYFQYMSPFCCIYFLTKGNKKMAVWLAIASFGFPLHNITYGEREAVLIFASNWAFCLMFFRPALIESVRARLKRIVLIVSIPFILYFIGMTIARFADSSQGSFDSVLAYGGDMPFFFSHIFNDPQIEAQKLGGIYTFGWIFPPSQRVQAQLNEYIRTDLYLNQFGGLPGSFYLDFGKRAILVILAFALAYLVFVHTSSKKNGKFPFHIFILFYFSFQVKFMNIFYFDYFGLFRFFLSLVFFITCWIYYKFFRIN